MKTSVIPTSLLRWLLSEHRGAAADAVVQHLTGVKIDGCDPRNHWPRDIGDAGRVIRLLDEVPEIAWMFERMAGCGPHWAAIVRSWDELRGSEGDGQRQCAILGAAIADAEGRR